MNVEDLELGDVVYAAKTIIDDGSMPNGTEGEILAEAGTRGVITLIGYVEEEPSRSVFLVRFEDKDMNLGNPIGCWVEDLAMAPKTINLKRAVESVKQAPAGNPAAAIGVPWGT
jgi:nitrogen fixation protein NifZ